VKGKRHTIDKYKIPSLVENVNGITIQKIQIPVLTTQTHQGITKSMTGREWWFMTIFPRVLHEI
jgi:hypothetical protein